MVYIVLARLEERQLLRLGERLLLLLHEGEVAERAHVLFAKRLQLCPDQRKAGQVSPAVAQDATVCVDGLHRRVRLGAVEPLSVRRF
jgi:hypothetical protein